MLFFNFNLTKNKKELLIHIRNNYVNFFENLKKKFKFVGYGLLVSVICGGLWFAISGSPFNLSNELATYTKVTIQTNINLAELDLNEALPSLNIVGFIRSESVYVEDTFCSKMSSTEFCFSTLVC